MARTGTSAKANNGATDPWLRRTNRMVVSVRAAMKAGHISRPRTQAIEVHFHDQFISMRLRLMVEFSSICPRKSGKPGDQLSRFVVIGFVFRSFPRKREPSF